MQLSHHVIVKKAQRLGEDRKQIAVLKNQLLMYDSELPRNLEAAKTKLNDAQAKLSQITDRIRSKMVTD